MTVSLSLEARFVFSECFNFENAFAAVYGAKAVRPQNSRLQPRAEDGYGPTCISRPWHLWRHLFKLEASQRVVNVVRGVRALKAIKLHF